MILGSLLRKYFCSLSAIVLVYSVLAYNSSPVFAATIAPNPTTTAPLFPLTPANAGQAMPAVAVTQLPLPIAPMQGLPLPIAPIMTAPIPLQLPTNNPTVILPPLFNTQSFVPPGTIPPPAIIPISPTITPTSPATPTSIVIPSPVLPSAPQPIAVSLTPIAEKSPAREETPAASQTLPPATPIVVIDPDTLTQEPIHPASRLPKPVAVIEGVLGKSQQSPVDTRLLYENKVLSFEEAPPCPVVPASLSSIPKPEPLPPKIEAVKKVEAPKVEEKKEPKKKKKKKKGKKKKGKKKKKKK